MILYERSYPWSPFPQGAPPRLHLHYAGLAAETMTGPDTLGLMNVLLLELRSPRLNNSNHILVGRKSGTKISASTSSARQTRIMKENSIIIPSETIDDFSKWQLKYYLESEMRNTACSNVQHRRKEVLIAGAVRCVATGIRGGGATWRSKGGKGGIGSRGEVTVEGVAEDGAAKGVPRRRQAEGEERGGPP